MRSATLASLISTASALYVDNATGVVAPCDSQIFCYGDLLRDVQLAQPFSDSKTFVDMPTTRPVDQVIAAYRNLTKPLRNDTQLQQFLSSNFGPPGTEIARPNRTFTPNITFGSPGYPVAPVVQDFARQVINIWPTLVREYRGADLCNGCETSSIPLNRTFVVAGGRFREAYYWDSYWILEGLLRAGGSYIDVSKDVILNFLDLVRLYGFVPNGSRKYYLNRSQPPMLTQMIRIYLLRTNDTSILQTALPLLEREQAYFVANNQIAVPATSANGTNSNVTLSVYRVDNNQPRPESFTEDYLEANNVTYTSSNGTSYPQANLTQSEKAALYAELATGAESGWDYSGGRWLKDVLQAPRGRDFPLRTLNVRATIPVDLNSIQYFNEDTLANFYQRIGNASQATTWRRRAAARKDAMYRVLFNQTMGRYYDFNTTSGRHNTHLPTSATNTTQQEFFSPAQYFPFWAGAAPDELRYNYTRILAAFAPVERELREHVGGLSATDIQTGQQWDSPNVWPPLQDIVMEAASKLEFPRGFDTINRTGSVPRPITPAAQSAELRRQQQAWRSLRNISFTVAQRYLDSTYCTWRSTGGSHASLNITRLPGFDNATDPSVRNATGTMFEKYSNMAIDAVGSGGEYTVVPGFGWSNGLLIKVVKDLGSFLDAPQCGNITANTQGSVVTKRSLKHEDRHHAEQYIAARELAAEHISKRRRQQDA